jgi:hypothetical protein
VFVAGGTQDGVYLFAPGYDAGEHLGFIHLDLSFRCRWIGDRWALDDVDDNVFYYSLSDVATPDLATDWKNASDDTPASITVTSVSEGDLAAGFKWNDATWQRFGNTNGYNRYQEVGQEIEAIQFSVGFGWQYTGDDTILNIGNVAFPWEGTPEVPVTKSDVAAEENWVAT